MLEEDDKRWIDKKIPLAHRLLFLIQTVTIVYIGTTWKSDIDYRLNSIEATISERAPNSNRITILEQQFIYITKILNSIEDKLDKAREELEKRETK